MVKQGGCCDSPETDSVESMHSNPDPDLSSQTKSLSGNSINQVKISAPKTSSIPRPPPKRHRSESGSLSSSPNRIKKLNRDTRSNHQVIGDSVLFMVVVALSVISIPAPSQFHLNH